MGDITVQDEWWRINLLFSPPVILIGCSVVHVPCAPFILSTDSIIIIILIFIPCLYHALPQCVLGSVVRYVLGLSCTMYGILAVCLYFLCSHRIRVMYSLCSHCTRIKIFVPRTRTYLISNIYILIFRSVEFPFFFFLIYPKQICHS